MARCSPEPPKARSVYDPVLWWLFLAFCMSIMNNMP
jgi:hypothetical protein